MKVKKITCIGAGFVGGPTMAVIALKCPEISITVVDKDSDKIDKWNGDVKALPVFEPGLSDIIKKVRNNNLFFSNDIKTGIEEADMIFMAVSTPTKTQGKGKGYAADLTNVKKCALDISKYSKSDMIVVEKSTLPVRTAETIKEVLVKSNGKVQFEVLSNPEFLAEGTAINDLFKSDRVLIGGENTKSGKKAINKLKEIYLKWIPRKKILITNVWSSELSKLVSNAMLAQRISSINSISAICEHTGADIMEVSKAIGMDKRIGPEFLKPSIGFGGSCFKKDILNLVYIARTYNLNQVADYWEGVVSINSYQTNRVSEKVKDIIGTDIDNKTIAILGWAFKKNTNDSRESASIYITQNLITSEARVKIYDPMVNKKDILDDIKKVLIEKKYNKNKIKEFLKRVKICNNEYESLENSCVAIISTEWDQFVKLNWQLIFKKMISPNYIIDGRNILDKERLQKIGFRIYTIGQI